MMTQPVDFARFLNIRSAIAPVVSPAGDHVAFLSDITGTYQVWSVPAAQEQAWPRQLTFFADKVWELHGTAAAPHLVAVGDVGGNERQQFYLIDSYGVQADGTEAHNVRRLTTGDDAIHRFGAFSRDGMRIALTSNARNAIDFDLYILDLSTGDQTLIAEMPGNQSVAAWSPDERHILMLNAVATAEIEVLRVDVETGMVHHVTAQQPPARYQSVTWRPDGLYVLSDRMHDRFALCRLDPEDGALDVILDADVLLAEFPTEIGDAQTNGELELLAVASDARTAAVTLNVEGYSYLYRVDLEHASPARGAYRRMESVPDGVIADLRFTHTGDSVVFDLQSPQRNADVWWVSLGDDTTRQMTFSNRAGIAVESCVAPTLVHFPTFDDRDIPAFLYRPHTPPELAGYPCILYVHGGPAGQQRPDFDVRFQYFLSRGYAMLVTNVRGSTGYGRTYMGLDDVDKRMESVADLKYAVQWLHDQPDIDAQRIAIYGRSYGGFMVLAAMTEYPELFAAGIDVVGIANWVTFLERTSAWRRSHREREYGSLAHHRDLLQQISPIHKAERIQVPLLVVAGDNDPRVPLFESEQIVDRVRDADGSVEFIHYADEGHRISKLNNRVDSFTRMAAFLDRSLGVGRAGPQ
jgi:dipeptidyl aminopeptidase/acylaminoacyl peptidase